MSSQTQFYASELCSAVDFALFENKMGEMIDSSNDALQAEELLTFLEVLKASHASHTAIRENLASFIAEDNAQLETFNFYKTLGEVLNETELTVQAVIEEMLVLHRAEFIAHNQEVIAVFSEMRFVKRECAYLIDMERIRKKIEDEESIDNFLQGLADLDDAFTMRERLTGEIEASIEKSKATLAAFDNQLEEILEEFVQGQNFLADPFIEPETLEQQDRRIEREEEAKMQEIVEESIQRIYE